MNPDSPEFENLVQVVKTGDRWPDWPAGVWSRPVRNAYFCLLEITGKPSTAFAMMDELELWPDGRRPPPELADKWNRQWRQDAVTVPNKIQERIQKLYDGRRRSDMDETLRKANEAHRHISQTVINGRFDKDTSGALQHLGQIIAIGTEKRQQAFDPRTKSVEGQQITPTFVLMPPPERRQLPAPVEEVQVIDGR